MKQLFYPLVFVLSFLGLNAQAQVNIYNFTTSGTGAPNFVATNLSAGSFATVNGGGSNTPCSNGGPGVSGKTIGTTISSYTPSGFALNVDLTPASGYQVTVTSMTVQMRRSSTGPANARFAYSINGGTTWIDKGSDDFPNNGSCGQYSNHSWTLPAGAIAAAPGMFKFRIYFFNASNPSSGTLQVSNLYINGIVATSCTPPTATVTGGTTFCGNGNTNIVFNGTPNAVVTYKINGGANQNITLNASGTASLPTGNLTSTTTYSLVSAALGSCSGNITGSTVVTVNAIPTVTVNHPNDSICFGQNISLTASGATSYSWSPSGTLNAATGATVIASPTSTTIYTITGTTNGCSSSAASIIKVNPLPGVVVLPINDSVCLGQNIVLSASGADNYTWAPGISLSNTTGATVTATPTTTTSYTVTGTNLSGCSATATALIKVNPLPLATITPATSPIFCPGGSVLLNGNTGSNLSYQWKLNGVNIPGATNANYNTSTAGDYILVVKNNNTQCKDSSAIQHVISSTAPPASVTPSGNVPICNGTSAIIQANTGIGLSYQWMLNGNPISGETNSSYTTSAAGNYTVKVSSGPNCFSNTSAAVVSILPLPPTAFTPAATQNVCPGFTTTFTAPSGSYNYQWQFNGTDIPAATNMTYTTGNAGLYTLSIKNNTTGCADTSSGTVVQIAPVPTATINYTGPTTFCVTDDSLLLTANNGIGLSYKWERDAVIIPGAVNASLFAPTTGNYRVIVTNGFNCSTTSTPVSVTAHPKPEGTITYSSPLAFCQGGAVALNILQLPGNSYQWRLNGNNISGATGPVNVASAAGAYTIHIVNSFGCEIITPAVNVTVYPMVYPVATFGTQQQTLTTQNYASYQWFYNGAPIGGATGKDYKYDKNGAYYVLVTDNNGCTNHSNIMLINNTGVRSIAATDIKVYPNPANDVVHVDAPFDVRVSIIDLTGRVVITAFGKDPALQLGALNAGVYMVRIYNKEEQLLATTKLVKAE